MNTKYIFITGGVVSGLGKGITAASLGRLLKNRGYKVAIQKLDPYINVDPGTMNPYEHGEVFVTEDGAETDLDLGHYERFIDENLNRNSSVTMGRIYLEVIEEEREGKYLGKTVQVIPHITDKIKEKIYSFEDTNTDIVITEIGGTVGDIEGLSIIEAIRQVGLEKNPEDVLYVHVTLLPYISGSNEIKSKPTQHSVKELQSMGIKPDILVCRTEQDISETIREKLALFCNVRKSSVIQNKTADCLYAVPLLLEKEGLAREVCNHLRLDRYIPDNTNWQEMIDTIRKIREEDTLKVAIVGKYVKLEDSYISVVESLRHCGYQNQVKVEVDLIDSESIQHNNVKEKLQKYQGIVVPGGFGNRGIEGKIKTIQYARENNIPFLGICLGMQMAVVEFARNVLKLEDAHSAEFSKTTQNPVIHIMEEQKGITEKGGTMRLGSYPCYIKENSKVYEIYGKKEITERHRHRYEYNNEYREKLEKAGLICSGVSPDGKLVEIVELKNHPYFIGVQFHPELKSRPNKPAPVFNGLIKAMKERKNKMILVDKNIKELVKQDKLITKGYKEENVNSISYDLTIDTIINKEENEMEQYELNPQEYCFIKTIEKLEIPENIMGRIADKNSLIRLGLDVSKINYFPGHITYAFLRVYNISNQPITLKKDFKIAQIIFEELKEIPEITYDKQKGASFNQEEKYVGVGSYSNLYHKIIGSKKEKKE